MNVISVCKPVHDRVFRMVDDFVTARDIDMEMEARLKGVVTLDRFTHIVRTCRSTPGMIEAELPEQLDVTTVANGVSYRATIIGKEAIRAYCVTGQLDGAIIVSKKKTGSLCIDDLGFSVTTSTETPVPVEIRSTLVLQLSDPVMFRYKKRYTYRTADGILRYDLTIVRTSRDPAGSRSLTVIGAVADTYEVEIEIMHPVDGDRISVDDRVAALYNAMYLLASVAPVTGRPTAARSPDVLRIDDQSRRERVVMEYLSVFSRLGNAVPFSDVLMNPRLHFMGPQPVTIQRDNVLDARLGGISLKEAYTVTEKADGERYLLFLDKGGVPYLIDNRLQVFDIRDCPTQKLRSTVLDGELIRRDGAIIFAMFDVYAYRLASASAMSTWRFPLINVTNPRGSREFYMKEVEGAWKARPDTSFRFYRKKYMHGTDIFALCREIMTAQVSAVACPIPYAVDGLIFTPMDLPVGAEHTDPGTVMGTGSWSRLIKWKPAHENSIDFVVSRRDDEDGERVFRLYVTTSASKSSVFITPSRYVTEYRGSDDEGVAAPNHNRDVRILTEFNPTTEYGPNDIRSVSHLRLAGDDPMVDIIQDGDVVEMWFDTTACRWVPKRVRTDKKTVVGSSAVGNANDVSVALSIWFSIFNPVTEAVITGVEVPDYSYATDDSYYNRRVSRDKFASKNMMMFHTIDVKTKLVFGLISSHFKDRRRASGQLSMFDIACGQAGDLNRWIAHGFNKVLGVDIDRSNIQSPANGAYERTLQLKSDPRRQHMWKRGTQYIYVTLDASRKLNAAYFDTLTNIHEAEDQLLARTMWNHDDGGFEPPERFLPYKGFASKFDCVGCQFALHYFFETEDTLDNLVYNIDTHLADGGVFVGTCLDGKKVLQKLADLPVNGVVYGKKHNTVMWEIQRRYDAQAQQTQVYGKKIGIYMESIGKQLTEYIVDFDHLVRKLADVRIHLLKSESFEQAYNKGGKNRLDKAEQEYSFLNLWFAFEKRSGVPAPGHSTTSSVAASTPPTNAVKPKLRKKSA